MCEVNSKKEMEPKWWTHKWGTGSERNFAIHGPRTEIEFNIYKTSKSHRHVGLTTTVGSGGEHWITMCLGLWWMHFYVSWGWHPLSNFWYKRISKQNRRLGLSISNDRFELSLFSIDNDYGSEYRWLKDRGCKEENIAKVRNQLWFKIVWRIRCGFNYSLWWERFIGYEAFVSSGLTSNQIFKLDFAMDEYHFRIVATIEKGHLEYNKPLGSWLHRKTANKETFIKFNYHIDDTAPAKIPMRLGKGENSWDGEPEYCIGETYLGKFQSEVVGAVENSKMPHELRNPLDTLSEAFLRQHIWETIHHQWRKYGKHQEVNPK